MIQIIKLNEKTKDELLKYKFFKKIKKIKDRIKNKFEKYLLLYPKIETKELLADLINRLSFYIPKAHVCFIISEKLNIYINNLNQLETPAYQERYIKNSNKFIFKNNYNDNCFKSKRILLHDAKFLNTKFIISKKYEVTIIDPNYKSTISAENYRSIYNKEILSKNYKNKLKLLSYRNFKKFYTKNKHKKEAICYVSGPSFKNYNYLNTNDINKKFNIICNSLVKDSVFLDQINGGDLLVFADPVFHFSPCNYSVQFRKDVIKLVKKYSTYIAVPESTVGLLLYHYPILKKFIIGVSFNNDLKKYCFISKDSLVLKPTYNILTLLMLPIASYISDTISIIGADGRLSNETYFWKHNSNVQYNDKMESVFKTHPSFFRDRNYSDYYEKHCKILNNMIKKWEKNNKKVYKSLTLSYIDVLKKRIDYSLYNNKLKLLSQKYDHIDENFIISKFFKSIDNEDKERKIMIDVGAHFGGSLKHFINDNWYIYGFEPDKNNRKELVQNYSKYSNLKIEAVAISNIIKKNMPFYTSDISTGISSLNPFHDSYKNTQKINTITLKKYCQENNIKTIDYLKIDTEGYDKFVLESLPWNVIHPRIIQVEFEDSKTITLGYNFNDFCKYIMSKEYYLIISEWEPIVKYGIKHKWDSFKIQPYKLNNDKAWGNILAFRDYVDYKFFLDNLEEII